MAEMVLDWGDEIVDSGKEQESFVVLPGGDYSFKVSKMEKEYYEASPTSKIPSCPKAVVHMIIDGGSLGRAYVRENIYLLTSMQWKIASLFQCVGLVEKGEKRPMPWNELEGCDGVVRIKKTSYSGRDGEEHEKNEVDRFLSNGSEPKDTLKNQTDNQSLGEDDY